MRRRRGNASLKAPALLHRRMHRQPTARRSSDRSEFSWLLRELRILVAFRARIFVAFSQPPAAAACGLGAHGTGRIDADQLRRLRLAPEDRGRIDVTHRPTFLTGSY